MKRQIKFRAKTTSNGHWVCGSLNTYNNGECAIRNSKSEPWVDPSTVGQFTGLRATATTRRFTRVTLLLSKVITHVLSFGIRSLGH